MENGKKVKIIAQGKRNIIVKLINMQIKIQNHKRKTASQKP